MTHERKLGDRDEMWRRALRALLAAWDGNVELAERVVRRVAATKEEYPITWKDGARRNVIRITAEERGVDAHELSQRTHIDDWTALGNFPEWRSAELGLFLADALQAIRGGTP